MPSENSAVLPEHRPGEDLQGPGPGRPAGRVPFDLLAVVVGDAVMLDIFSEARTVRSWLQFEVALADGQVRQGIVPAPVARALREVAVVERLNLDALWTETVNVGYPILPLIRQIDALLPASMRGYIHLGATTQDVMDSGLAVQLREAFDRLDELAYALGDALLHQAGEHAMTVMPGRTHGQQAVPTTLGAKLAVYVAEVARHRERLFQARPRACQLSMFGAGGTSAAYGGQIAALRTSVSTALGLAAAPVPWHVARDNIAEFASLCAGLAATAGRLAREIVDLSRTEIGEIAEPTAHHRGASSTMPQKENPISSEATIGAAAAAAADVAAIYRAMEAGHERAAGEWQVEWTVIPRLACLAAATLNTMAKVVQGMRVFPDQMRANLGLDGGLILAEAYMMRLAPEVGRERAHDIVYGAVQMAREMSVPLHRALLDCLDEHLGKVIGVPIAIDDYLGEAPSMPAKTRELWNAGGSRDRREHAVGSHAVNNHSPSRPPH